MITLRDYQAELVPDVRDAYRTGRKAPLLVLPTGGGKTVFFCFVANGTAAKGNSVLILVHRSELVDQTSETLRKFGVDHGIIAAGRTPDRSHPVQVASVQTIVRRLGFFRPSLIIIDEAHHGTAGSWRKVIDANPQAKILGVTATPERLDGRGLSEIFDELIRGPEVRDLVMGGYLTKPTYFAPPPKIAREKFHTVAGDFNKSEIAEAMDKPAIIGDAVERYASTCPGAPAIVFCVSLDHAHHVRDQFNEAGFRAEVIDGTLDKDTRRDRVAALGDGRLQLLISVDIVSEGFDLPIVTAAILLRPTMSLGLHLQQIGRVLRPVYAKGMPLDTPEQRLAAIAAGPKPRAIILDHVGNLKNHQYAETVREWSLEGTRKGGKKKRDEQPGIDVSQCPACFCCHEPAPECPECGHVYPIIQGGRQLAQVDGTLVEISEDRECECGAVHNKWDLKCPACGTYVDPKRQRAAEMARCQSLDDLIALGRRKGYRNPVVWAQHVHNARMAKRACRA